LKKRRSVRRFFVRHCVIVLLPAAGWLQNVAAPQRIATIETQLVHCVLPSLRKGWKISDFDGTYF
jgi:hypothetical protein